MFSDDLVPIAATYRVTQLVRRLTRRPLAPRRLKQQCRVYWGTHGCHKHRGHRGVHRCFCRDYLVPRTSRRRSLPVYAYGEDWTGPTLRGDR